MRNSGGVTTPTPDRPDQAAHRLDLPPGWSAATPHEPDVAELTELLRRQEEHGRGWAGAAERDVLVEVSEAGYLTRENVVVRDPDGELRGWARAHDRASGRMLLVVVVDPRLDDALGDRVAQSLFAWAEEAAREIGARRGLHAQQIDSGAFADDARQRRWLASAGYAHVRTWWQMSRPVAPEEADLDPTSRSGVRVRRVEREGGGLPSADDLHTVHDVLEEAFADHFNSHTETFEEFLSRLRSDPGHRWDHWWLAEIVDEGHDPVPAGTLVGSVKEGSAGRPDGSYVEYLGVRKLARGRGVASALLRTIIADAAARGRDRVGLEVDADSPTGADRLYVSMGWTTAYLTESWHREVAVAG